MLKAVFVRIGVIQNPSLARQIGAMTVLGHDLRRDDADLLAVVGVEIEFAAMRGMMRPGKHVGPVPPDEMRGAPVGIEDIGPATIGIGCKHPGAKSPLAFLAPPAVQEDKPPSAGRHQQVVEIMFDPAKIRVRVRYRGRLRDGQDQLALPGHQIDAPDAGILRREHAAVGVGDARIAVSGTRVVNAPEVGRDRPLAVRRKGVDRRGQRPLLTCLDIENVRDELPVLAVVPNDLRRRTGQPLQHAALLPSPGAAFSQVDPAVVVGEIDHADADHVIGPRRAMLEIHFHAEHVPVRRVELQLVVVAEPVKFRAAGDGAHRRQLGFLSQPRERAAETGQRGGGPQQRPSGRVFSLNGHHRVAFLCCIVRLHCRSLASGSLYARRLSFGGAAISSP